VLAKEYGPLDNLHIFDHALPVGQEDRLEADLNDLRELQYELEDMGERIALIVNDTLKRSIDTMQANDSAVAAKFTNVVEGLRKEFGCAVLVNAHPPKSGTGIGGSEDILNAATHSFHLIGRKDGPWLKSVRCCQLADDKNRVGVVEPFVVDCRLVELPKAVGGNTHDVILGNYRKDGTKAKQDDAPVVECTAEVEAPAVDPEKRVEEICERHRQGQSNKRIATEMKIRRATVIQVVRQANEAAE
jgi:hypothetical protein